MASLIARPARLVCSTIRSQCPRAALLAVRTPLRAASTTTNTPSTTNLPPPTAPPSSSAASQSSHTSHSDSTSHLPANQPKFLTARVTRAGYMDKTVRASIATHEWDNHLRKFYRGARPLLVHDPANSLREGDMIRVRALEGQKTAQVRHVVHEILVPFGSDIVDRPAVPSEAELAAEHAAALEEKVTRRTLRARAEKGDEDAIKEVAERKIGVREIVKGKGRGRRVRRVLERDFGKK